MNIALCRFVHNHGSDCIAAEGSLKPGLCPTLFSNDLRVLYSAQYHGQHCTLHPFEQFGALYMYKHDEIYPAHPRFEPGISRLQVPVDTKEPLGQAVI